MTLPAEASVMWLPTFRSRTRAKSREEGQALVLFVLGFAVFAGLVGLAIDVGQIVATRTDLQKTADAAALAAAQDLPNTTVAQVVADLYVLDNGGTDTSATVTFSGTYAANDTVTVEAKRHVGYTFMRVLGLSGTDVTAKAIVRVGHYAGGTGVLPWGFIASDDPTSTLLQNSCFVGFGDDGLPDFQTNTSCTLKFGAGTNSGGDFGSLVIGQTGADEYRDNIKYGSSSAVKKGDQLDPQTGNMEGPTRTAVNDRLGAVPSNCDTAAEALEPDGFGGMRVADACQTSPNIIVIPVVDKIDNSNNAEKSTVLGFAFMFLEGSTNQGGQTQIKAQFINFVEELPNGVYEGFGDGPRAIDLIG
jgi:Flp pilus assembly protein TadG